MGEILQRGLQAAQLSNAARIIATGQGETMTSAPTTNEPPADNAGHGSRRKA